MKNSSSKTGYRVVINEFADSPIDAINNHIEMVEQPYPDTNSLLDTDVVIRVTHATVGWVDLLMTSGQYQHMPKPPYTPGLEYAGVIDWVGNNARPDLSVGDAVYIDGWLAGPRSLGNYQQYGGFASYTVAPQEAVRALPAGFTPAQGCNLLGSYETAYHCLVARGNLQAGETILIHGASGSTGLAAVHMAKILGATVIATGRNPDKLAIVKEQGADHVINTSNEDGTPGMREFRGDVKALTGGKGVDVVYDGVGGPISLESLRCVKFGARYLIVGWAATPNVAKGKGGRGAPNANMLPTNLMMMKGLSVLGSPMAISTAYDPSIRPPRLQQIMDWVAEGKIKPYVSHTFPFNNAEDVQNAMRAKWNGQIIGGGVLEMPAIE